MAERQYQIESLYVNETVDDEYQVENVYLNETAEAAPPGFGGRTHLIGGGIAA